MGIAIVAFYIGLGFVAIFSIIGIFFFLALALRFLDYNTAAPEFFDVDNVFGWIVVIIGFLVVAAAVGAGLGLLSGIVMLPGSLAIFAGTSKEKKSIPLIISGGAWVAVIWAAMIIGVGYLTHYFMEYVSENPELSEFFASGSWFAYVLAFLVFLGVLFPSASNSD